MESKPINRLILEYSITVFISLLFSALYNTVDTLFVSRGIGDTAMAGVSIVSPFMMLQSAFAQMIGLGAGTLISNYLGKKEFKKAGNITLNAMAVFYSVTAIVIFESNNYTFGSYKRNKRICQKIFYNYSTWQHFFYRLFINNKSRGKNEICIADLADTDRHKYNIRLYFYIHYKIRCDRCSTCNSYVSIYKFFNEYDIF